MSVNPGLMMMNGEALNSSGDGNNHLFDGGDMLHAPAENVVKSEGTTNLRMPLICNIPVSDYKQENPDSSIVKDEPSDACMFGLMTGKIKQEPADDDPVASISEEGFMQNIVSVDLKNPIASMFSGGALMEANKYPCLDLSWGLTMDRSEWGELADVVKSEILDDQNGPLNGDMIDLNTGIHSISGHGVEIPVEDNKLKQEIDIGTSPIAFEHDLKDELKVESSYPTSSHPCFHDSRSQTVPRMQIGNQSKASSCISNDSVTLDSTNTGVDCNAAEHSINMSRDNESSSNPEKAPEADADIDDHNQLTNSDYDAPIQHTPKSEYCPDPEHVKEQEKSMPQGLSNIYSKSDSPIGVRTERYLPKHTKFGSISEKRSNRWIRSIRKAGDSEKPNIEMYKNKNKLYCRTSKTVQIHQELLVKTDISTSWLVSTDSNPTCTDHPDTKTASASIKIKKEHKNCKVMNPSKRKTKKGHRTRNDFECNERKNQDQEESIVSKKHSQRKDKFNKSNVIEEKQKLKSRDKKSSHKSAQHDTNHITQGRSELDDSDHDRHKFSIPKQENLSKPYCCTECKKCFLRKDSFILHMRMHSGSRPYKCNECGKRFTQKSNMRTHQRSHENERNYACDICDKRFNYSTALRSHMRGHTGDKPFVCEICHKAFSRPGGLQIHSRVHSGDKPFTCPVCNKSFRQYSHLDGHVKIHSGIKPHICKVCNKAFILIQHLKDHERRHSGEKPYLCSDCGKDFVTSSSLQAHRLVHTEIRSYQCTECDSAFKKAYHLEVHSRMHSGLKPYCCNICGKSFGQSSNLRTHKKTHSKEKKLPCIQCGKCFATKDHLKKHMKIHSGEKPFTCDICQKSFAEIRNLHIHKITHEKKPLKCPDCSLLFTDQKEFNIHRVIHIGKKPFSCPECSKGFRDSNSMRVHQRIHSGEKPFECSDCGNRFTALAQLQRHAKVHTGDKPFKFKICSRTFALKQNLQRHGETHSDKKPHQCPQCEKSFRRKDQLKTHSYIHRNKE